MKKHQIEVCQRGEHYGAPGPIIKVVTRALRAEYIGNFIPFFCTYKGKKHLVQSRTGDLSDPFRREESYFSTLYIEV